MKLEPDHCSSVDASGYQCRRPKNHHPELLHYANGVIWNGDYTEKRDERGLIPLVYPAPEGKFMRARNPFIGIMEP